jgi:tetratricopeptide (TPR) repeat protein
MRSPLHRALLALFFLGTCLPGSPASAESGFLVVHVQDVQGHPVRGVQIGVKGDGGSGTSDPHGTVRIRLASQTQVKDWVTLQVLHSPPGKDLVLLSPWDSRAVVPSFENKSDNFVDVVVVESGDRAALANPAALRAFAEKINKANAPKSADKQAAEDPKANLDAVAKQYGLTPEDLDKAIRAWAARTTDPYDVGLAALYARNYDAATTSLTDSLKQREEKFATAQEDVADAAFFLGKSLYGQGKYRESAVAYQRCLQIRPDDPAVLHNTALSLKDAGDYAGAEPLFRRAVAIDETTSGRDHPEVADDLINWASLLEVKGDYFGAESLYWRALSIIEKTFGPDDPNVAPFLHNLASLLSAERHYMAAEELYRRALAINEKALGPDHPRVAADLGNLGLVLYARGDYAAAEPPLRRALAIDEKALGPDHPDVARALDNLAGLLKAEGNYASAEPLLRRALAIEEKTLGPDHPDVATTLTNLGGLLYGEGDYAAAEPLVRRALAIDEKALGPDHPKTRQIKSHLHELLQRMAQTTPPKPKN